MLPPKMMIASGALLAASLVAASAAQAQTVWYVNDDGDPDNGCTSWPDACPELQTSLSRANAGDQIWVAAGVYVPSEVDYPEYPRLATFELIGGVEIYGGFDGTESKLDQRAGLFDQTILSGDLNGDGGAAGNSYHVVTGSGTDATARLDGFTITGGSADGAGEWGEWEVEGGGLFIEDGDPIIVNCIFTGNFAVLGGGIFTAGDSTPLVSNCRFIDNSAGVCGGGMCNSGSSPTVIECSFVNNSEFGVYCSPGICWDGGCGGGMGNFGGSPIVTNCSFIGNIAYAGWEGDGGGGMCGGSPTITNCIFSGNTAQWGYGGALLVGAAIITNSTFSSNTAENGGGINCADATVTNCILWGNNGGEIVERPGWSATVSYSDVQGGWPGIGNIDTDPLFVDVDGPDDDPATWQDNDYRLSAGSPCIDGGNNLAVPHAVVTDLDGLARFADAPDTPDTGYPGWGVGIVDMGTYEFGADDCNNNGTPDVQDVANGTSLDCDQNSIPDECQPDCNDNGQPDTCDLSESVSEDCNANSLPDECEEDCNGNGQPDDCDVAEGFSEDCNLNGVPDECDDEHYPLITTQPADQEAEPGDWILFVVTAEGVGSLGYQWRKDGVELSDTERIFWTDTPMLLILEVEPVDAGSYDCVVTDLSTGCTTISDTATLTVLAPCPADLDGDGAVGAADLAELLGSWGPCESCPADLDGNGQVGPFDLALLLGNWGSCPQ
ncbi:MAG: hypothetical protein IID34_10780 [Planctomycetes bacterium]|nr:hypothetical protein [Planctomycetota bacterium]